MSPLPADLNFLWGAATSAHQVEGGNRYNDWWAWEQEGHIEGGVRSGPATDHWNRFREDLRLAQDMGLNSYRFSIEWSRIEPEQDRFDTEALEWYSELIAECERRALLPMVTLHHFTSPLWFAQKGGFTWEGAPERFGRFVRHIAKTLGPRVPFWCTLNEPMVLVAGTYLGKFMPPAVYSPELAMEACRQLLRAHVQAYEILHSEIRSRSGPWEKHPIQVGIAHNLLDFRADRPWHPAERILRSVFDRFYNRAWLDAVTGKKQRFGVPGLLPKPRPVREALGRRTVDFIGVNYYTKAYVQWRPRGSASQQPGELPIGLSFAKKNDVASDLGWAIHPEGFRRVLREVGRYGLPIYVTENGIADREDSRRHEFLLSHLRALSEAIAGGVDVRGYFHWSLLDNFEWIKGFGPRFGLYQVDYDSLDRAPTRAAQLYREIIAAHSSTDPPSAAILGRFDPTA